MVYESLLVFAVLVIAGIAYGVAIEQRHALKGSVGLSVVAFAVLGLYFVWFWTHGGQTVAMKAWRVRLVNLDGTPVRTGRALVRYVAAWLWLAPGLAIAAVAGVPVLGGGGLTAVLATNVLGYALLSRLHPERQFWHDALCGTRLIPWVGPPPRAGH